MGVVGVSSFRAAEVAAGIIRMIGASRSRTIRSSISTAGGVPAAWEMFSSPGTGRGGVVLISSLRG